MTSQDTIRTARALSLAAMAAVGATPAFADPADDVAGLLGCTACGGILIAIPIIVLALNIALLIWVAKDAKSRGMDTPVLWMLVVLCLSVIGLVIYLASRPKGDLIKCPHCTNNRLPALAQCPHCGRA